MIHDHSLIYKDKERLEEYTGNPRGIGNLLYGILLGDILEVTSDADRICALFNEAYWICTRVMIDAHPELHIKQYFPVIEDEESEDYKERIIVQALVFGLLLMYNTKDLRYFQFYTQFHKQYKEVPPALQHCNDALMQHIKDGLRFNYEFPVYWGELRHMQLLIVRGVMEDRHGEIYNWVDFLDRPTCGFDIFYFEQLLGIMTEDMRNSIISKLWTEIEYSENESKNGGWGLEVSKHYPELYHNVAIWNYAISKGKNPKIANPHPYQFMADDPSKEIEVLAEEYFNASHSFFMQSYYPRMEADLNKKLEGRSGSEKIEYITEELVKLKEKLRKSGYMEGMMMDVAQKILMVDVIGMDKAMRDHRQELFDRAIDEIRLDVGKFNMEKVALYFYQNRNHSTEVSASMFLSFIELSTYLENQMLAELDKRNEATEDDDEVDEEYEAKAIEYYEKQKARYMKDFFPGAKESLGRLVNTFKEGIEGWNDHMTLVDDMRMAMIESGFIKHYHIEDEVYDAEDEELLMMGDEEYADTMLTLRKYQNCISDLMNDDGSVDTAKAARYIYNYREVLNETQLNTYFNWVEGQKYVDELLTKRHRDPSDLNNLYSMAMKNFSAMVIGKNEQSNQEKMLTCQFFAEELRCNRDASVLFLQILEKLNPDVNKKKGRRATKIQWPHVKAAWENLNLIDHKLSPTEFGICIHSVLEARTPESVKQSFKPDRLDPNFPTATDTSVIADIVDLFKPVLNILPPRNS